MNQIRSNLIGSIEDRSFDVVVVGAGINGASVFRELKGRGLKVLLIDKGDFAGCTSQATSMLVWGGIIHMKQLRFHSVWQLSKCREELISQFSDHVRSQPCRLLQRKEVKRNHLVSFAGFAAYWLFGMQRSRPSVEKDYSELGSILNGELFHPSVLYEEAMVYPSDSRFILSWIIGSAGENHVAANYCSIEEGEFDDAAQKWRLKLQDRLTNQNISISAGAVVNTAGIWTDKINDSFGIKTRYRHIFGKGVSLVFDRDPNHEFPLMIETPDYRDCMSLIPWGPVSIWGPNETRVDSIDEGYVPRRADVVQLLEQANRHFVQRVDESDIVSIRCGVRPLVVNHSFSDLNDCLEISRRHLVVGDKKLPWISVFGGKLTSSVHVARKVSGELKKYASVRPATFGGFNGRNGSYGNGNETGHVPASAFEKFPGIEAPLASASWCADNEMCWTLEDYLRRRTNIAQWVPRGGLGNRDENIHALIKAASSFTEDEQGAVRAVNEYRENIRSNFDPLLIGSRSPNVKRNI